MSETETVPITLPLLSSNVLPIVVFDPSGNVTTATFSVGVQTYNTNSGTGIEYNIYSIAKGQWVAGYQVVLRG